MKIKQDINIGKNIRRLRMEANLTQEQVAAKMQLYGAMTSRQAYSQMEMGIYNIRISELFILKEIFNTTYDVLFQGVSDSVLPNYYSEE